jgi:nickel-dependent lactate racemase
MPLFQLSYGHKRIELDLPARYSADWIEPPYVPSAEDPLEIVRQAIANPVDGRPISGYLPAQTVAIAINDKTRPVPHEHLLPPLLEALHAVGIPAGAISFYIATGTHIPMPADEFSRILPREIYEKYHVVSHNCDDEPGLVTLGKTARGTTIRANRYFVESDLRIVVGNIEPHHFAGFSGGYKTAAIGLGARDTINHNHAMLVEPDARIAEFLHNPLRQDIEEMGDAIGVQFALNAILNSEKKIVRAVSGSPRAVMQAGIPISQGICQVSLGDNLMPGDENYYHRYDLVVASVGGAPKDINFYQSQKALTHASLFTRDGGVIILAAECPEGSGSRSYEEFMEGISSPQAVFEKFRQVGFRVGPHKAFQVARDAARVRIILVSSIPDNLVSRLLMTPAANLDQAFILATQILSPTPNGQMKIAILPRATNTVPVS